MITTRGTLEATEADKRMRLDVDQTDLRAQCRSRSANRLLWTCSSPSSVPSPLVSTVAVEQALEAGPAKVLKHLSELSLR